MYCYLYVCVLVYLCLQSILFLALERDAYSFPLSTPAWLHMLLPALPGMLDLPLCEV